MQHEIEAKTRNRSFYERRCSPALSAAGPWLGFRAREFRPHARNDQLVASWHRNCVALRRQERRAAGDGGSRSERGAETLPRRLSERHCRKARPVARTRRPHRVEHASPDIHRAAQDRFLAAGQEAGARGDGKAARRTRSTCGTSSSPTRAAGRFPKGLDVFRHKFFGLFYVAPAQDSFMCRLRMPNGILDAHQLRGLADIAEHYGGGYADVTTRANLQIREIGRRRMRRRC